MNETNLMDYIPPEQIGYIVAAIMGFIGTIIVTLGIFVRWLFGYFARVQDEKLNAMRQERELEKIEAEAKQRQRDMEYQRQLDETHTGRETMLRWFDALSEERRDNAEQRKASERKETIYIQAIQGIESNAAATFNLMKEMSDRLSRHTESDETMEAQQMKIIAQGETTHERLSTMAGVIDAIVVKLDNITATKKSDEKVLQDIHKLLSELKESFQRLESSPVATPVTKTDTQAAPINEVSKELQAKEEPQ